MAKTTTIQCPDCPTTITIDEANRQRMAGRAIACPICAAYMKIPADDAGAAGATAQLRLQCPACTAIFSLERDAYLKMVGSSIKCLKCDADIPVHPIEAAPVSSPGKDSTAVAPVVGTPTSEPHKLRMRPGPVSTGAPCRSCGTRLPDGVTLCPACGTDQNSGKQEIADGSLMKRRPFKAKRIRQGLSWLLNMVIKGLIIAGLIFVGYLIYLFVESQLPH
jgi:hypothetical protein